MSSTVKRVDTRILQEPNSYTVTFVNRQESNLIGNRLTDFRHFKLYTAYVPKICSNFGMLEK